jgi:hypothetical protein
MTASSDLEEIQRIAYELWQIEGEPEGRDHEHWERARRIFESRTASGGSVAQRPRETARPAGPGAAEVAPVKGREV